MDHAIVDSMKITNDNKNLPLGEMTAKQRTAARLAKGRAEAAEQRRAREAHSERMRADKSGDDVACD